jgi:hypothetical protein
MSTININTACQELCKLTTGLTYQCNIDSQGGNVETFKIINLCDIVSFVDTYDTGVIDTINLKPGAVWFEATARKDTLQITETYNVENGGFTYAVIFSLFAIADGLTPELGAAKVRDFVTKLANPTQRFVVVTTANHGGGISYVYGANRVGLRLSEMVFDTTLTTEETANFQITLSGPGKLGSPVDPAIVLPLV